MDVVVRVDADGVEVAVEQLPVVGEPLAGQPLVLAELQPLGPDVAEADEFDILALGDGARVADPAVSDTDDSETKACYWESPPLIAVWVVQCHRLVDVV